MRVLTLFATAALATTASALTKTDNKTGFSWDPANFKVAAVRYPPANYAYPIGQNRTWVDLDLNATIDRAIEFIDEAGAEGVKLMAFPEIYFPGFPIALNFNFTPPNFAQYASQAMVHEGPEWKRLTAAFVRNKMYAVVSFAEVSDDALYMGQYLVGPDGSTIHKHRKLRPSGSERNLFSDGDIESIRSVTLPFGTVTYLSCWENLEPTMRYVAAAQPANLHIASFPYCSDSNPDTEWWEHCAGFRAVVQTYTQAAGVAAIFSAIGKVSIWDVAAGFVPNSGNSTDALDPASFERMPYITYVYNTTTWGTPTYDLNSMHSWGALMQIVSGTAPDVPRKSGTFWNHYVTKIQDLAKYYVFTDSTGSAVSNSSNYPSLYENFGETYTVVQSNEYY
ncbi:carbon-nitrogen hydrolase [Lipomyces kononenkoae]|uniref:Carbon-nitrogen hydrolase n=1 Tax=Lipomyces kononenkoae TaxID=34357 RepID=A0ACC3SSB2_LIPKO